jgi:hypothetical protein
MHGMCAGETEVNDVSVWRSRSYARSGSYGITIVFDNHRLTQYF